MTNTHIHVPEAPFWDRDIYGSAMHNGVPVFSKIGRGPRGYKGDKGDKGDTGATGEEGFSPWTEFAYPDDPSYPLEPDDDHYGHPVIIVHDRDGDHWYALDPKPDPDSMDDADLAKLAGLLTNKKLWPRWIEWGVYPTGGQLPPPTENIDAYTRIQLDGFYGLYNEVELQGGTTQSFVFPDFPKDPASEDPSSVILSANDFIINDARFSRNGLDYRFMKGPGEDVGVIHTSIAQYPHFLLSSNLKYLYLYPQIETRHPLEEVILRLYLYPKYPEE